MCTEYDGEGLETWVPNRPLVVLFCRLNLSSSSSSSSIHIFLSPFFDSSATTCAHCVSFCVVLLASYSLLLRRRVMEVESRYVAVRHHVEGLPSEDDFEVKAARVRWWPESGEVLVRNLYLSVDPYQLNRMKRRSASHLAVDGIVPGEVICCSPSLSQASLHTLRRRAHFFSCVREEDRRVRRRRGGGVGVRGVQGGRRGRRRAGVGGLHPVPAVPRRAHVQARRLRRPPLVTPPQRTR